MELSLGRNIRDMEYFRQRELRQTAAHHRLQQQRPSFFELVACEQLDGSIRPALRYVFSVFVETHPEGHWVRLYNWFDELYAVVQWLVQSHYLRTWNATFSEQFYGVKRVPVIISSWSSDASSLNKTTAIQESSTTSLDERQVRLSLVSHVLVPYVAQKCQDAYERWTGGSAGRAFQQQDETDSDSDDDQVPLAQTTNNTSVRSAGEALRKRYPRVPLWLLLLALRAKKVFLAIYPYAYMIVSLLHWIYELRFMFERSPYWSPWMQLLGATSYSRITSQDHMKQQQLEQEQAMESTTHPLRTLRNRILQALKVGIPSAVLFLKFLEWWYTTGQAQAQQEGLAVDGDILPPPETFPILHQPPMDVAKCPVCRRKRTNPCQLTLSGYVFCYPCIFGYLDRERKCPVTEISVPASMQTSEMASLLRKIYDE